MTDERMTPGVRLREAIRDVLATCTCTPFPQGTGPEIDCPMHGRADYQADALAPVVERIVAARLADVWDEGYDAGNSTPNPYRTEGADDA